MSFSRSMAIALIFSIVACDGSQQTLNTVTPGFSASPPAEFQMVEREARKTVAPQAEAGSQWTASPFAIAEEPLPHSATASALSQKAAVESKAVEAEPVESNVVVVTYPNLLPVPSFDLESHGTEFNRSAGSARPTVEARPGDRVRRRQ